MINVLAFIVQVATLEASHSKMDITPPEPLPLGGYTARQGKVMDTGGDPLYARTLILKQGSTKVAVVSLDMLTIPESLVREVKHKVGDQVKVMLVATHTHSAPDSQMLNDRMTFSIPGISSYKSRWLEWYSDKIATAIKEADKTKLERQETLYVDEFVPGLNRGRRQDANPIPEATILKGSFNFFVSYSAHATLMSDNNNLTNGDWPGRVSELMDTQVLPGTIGDVSPAAPDETDSVPSFSKTFVAKAASAKSRKLPNLSLSFIKEAIQLDPITPHPEFAKANSIPAPLAKNLVSKFAPAEGDLTLLKIGDVVVVGVPGEPTSDLGRRIVSAGKAAGFKTVIPVSHTNGWIGYILEPNDYEKAGYEATLAFHGPKTADRIVEASVKGFAKLK